MFEQKPPEYWATMIAVFLWIIYKAKENTILGKLLRGLIAAFLAFGTSEIIATELDRSEILMVLGIMIVYNIASDTIADLANNGRLLSAAANLLPSMLLGILAKASGVTVDELKTIKDMDTKGSGNDDPQ